MNSIGIRAYTILQGDTLWQLAQKFNTSVYAIAALNPGIDINYLRIGQKIYIWPGFGNYPVETVLKEYASGISKSQDALSKLIRNLWEQHVFWTYLTIRALLMDAPDAADISARLLENPADFKNALRPFYGDEDANRFAALLKEHLVIAAEIVNATKVGDSAAVVDAEKRWHTNADQISTLLSEINPYWNMMEWKNMLYDHLRLAKQLVVDTYDKNYEQAIRDFDKYESEALAMADMMTSGIVQQFTSIFL